MGLKLNKLTTLKNLSA